MALTIKWSRKSEKKFDLILDYLTDEFGEIRGFVIVKQITLFYQVRNNTIILLNFYDNRQKPKKSKF